MTLARICNPSVGNVTLGLQIRASGVVRGKFARAGLSGKNDFIF